MGNTGEQRSEKPIDFTSALINLNEAVESFTSVAKRLEVRATEIEGKEDSIKKQEQLLIQHIARLDERERAIDKKEAQYITKEQELAEKEVRLSALEAKVLAGITSAPVKILLNVGMLTYYSSPVFQPTCFRGQRVCYF